MGRVSALLASTMFVAHSGVANAAPSRDNLLRRHAERERAALLAPLKLARDLSADRTAFQPPRPRGPSVAPVLDLDHVTYDVRLAPSTGVTHVEVVANFHANEENLTSLGFEFDSGLSVVSVSVDGTGVTSTGRVADSFRQTIVKFDTPIAKGQSGVLRLVYEGTLECKYSARYDQPQCFISADFFSATSSAVLLSFFDPATTLPRPDSMTHEITYHLPETAQVISVGQRRSDSLANGERTAVWTIDKPLNQGLPMYMLVGNLTSTQVERKSSLTMFYFPPPQVQADTDLIAWTPRVLDFVESFAGRPLPFTTALDLARLPTATQDRGTATFGMTLLSQDYITEGDPLFEEIWAHENSHLFWAVLAPVQVPWQSQLLGEGLATLTEIDYAHLQAPDEDRDAYLKRRYLAIQVDIDPTRDKLPIALADGDTTSLSSVEFDVYQRWAYDRSAAVLDHLRVTIGDDVFSRGLGLYLDKCMYVGCRPEDFRAVMEQASGKSLSSFFDRWITATSRPRVTVGFTPAADGADITFTKPDTKPMALAIVVRLEDGTTAKQIVELDGESTTHHIQTTAPVRSVEVNGRHDIHVDVASAVEGDVDFDGETDGFDIVRCARQVGKKPSTRHKGLYNTTETFDPRCDLNHDNAIDDDDLNALAGAFGSLRGQ